MIEPIQTVITPAEHATMLTDDDAWVLLPPRLPLFYNNRTGQITFRDEEDGEKIIVLQTPTGLNKTEVA